MLCAAALQSSVRSFSNFWLDPVCLGQLFLKSKIIVDNFRLAHPHSPHPLGAKRWDFWFACEVDTSYSGRCKKIKQVLFDFMTASRNQIRLVEVYDASRSWRERALLLSCGLFCFAEKGSRSRVRADGFSLSSSCFRFLPSAIQCSSAIFFVTLTGGRLWY